MSFKKLVHNKSMNIMMRQHMGKSIGHSGNRKKIAKAMRARNGGKGESDGGEM